MVRQAHQPYKTDFSFKINIIMASVVINSLRKKKLPKAPKMNSSKAVWDNYEKRKKEVLSYNSKIDAEKSRRQKIKARR